MRHLRGPFIAAACSLLLASACASSSSFVVDGASCPPADDLREYAGCAHVTGDVVVRSADDDLLSALSELVVIDGSLVVGPSPGVTSLSALSGLRAVGGDLHLVALPELTDLGGLSQLAKIGGELHIIDVGITDCHAEDLTAGLDDFDTSAVELMGIDEDPHGCTPASDASSSDLPVSRLPTLDEMRRGYLLEEVHPELVDRMRLMYALLEEEGIEIVFVSGYRPHAWFDRPNRLASWHNLGMAVDLNLAHRGSLEEANRHFDEDEPKWRRIEEIATGLGIIWGERYDDIFHFEWHPGFHSRIRDHEFEQFQNLAGSDLEDHDEAWHLFSPDQADPDHPQCFGGCYHIPDDGLRHLLEALR